jgi:hypothetical protein
MWISLSPNTKYIYIHFPQPRAAVRDPRDPLASLAVLKTALSPAVRREVEHRREESRIERVAAQKIRHEQRLVRPASSPAGKAKARGSPAGKSLSGKSLSGKGKMAGTPTQRRMSIGSPAKHASPGAGDSSAHRLAAVRNRPVSASHAVAVSPAAALPKRVVGAQMTAEVSCD